MFDYKRDNSVYTTTSRMIYMIYFIAVTSWRLQRLVDIASLHVQG